MSSPGDGGGGVVGAETTAIGPWETITVIDWNRGPLVSGDPVSLRTVMGHYLATQNGGGLKVHARHSWADVWETFARVKVRGSGEIQYGDAVAFCTANGHYIIKKTNTKESFSDSF